jgi:hypothetical protein
VPVFGDFLADQSIELGQFLVQGDDFLCEGGDYQFPEVLGRESRRFPSASITTQ